MPAPATFPEFRELLVQSGLFAAAEIDDYLNRRPSLADDEPAQIAKQMIEDGILTRFQAEHLLRGKHRGLILRGKYKLLKLIGSGGMGSVYLAEHLGMANRLAIKVLPMDKAKDPLALGRFQREARAASSLQHPNIIRAYDLDEENGVHFLVMEYFDGISLHDLVQKQGAIDAQRAADFIRQASLGLQHAHERGMVHRDIKPSNLLVNREGLVKLLDMGLARFTSENDDLTTRLDSAAILGTADYLAPEQAIDSHGADIRSDIYSLGASLYYLLAGQVPFPGGSAAQKLLWLQMRQPTPLLSLRPELPPGLVAIVDRMMAKDPNHRFQTPGEVAVALTTGIHLTPPPSVIFDSSVVAYGIPPAPSSSHSGGPSTETARTSSSDRTILLDAPAPHNPFADLPTEETTHSNRQLQQTFADNRQLGPIVLLAVTAVIVIGGAIAAWLMMSSSRPQPTSKESVVEGNPTGPTRPGDVKPLAPLTGLLKTLPSHNGPVLQIAVSANGKWAVSIAGENTARIWNLDKLEPVHELTGHTESIQRVGLAPDSQRVVTASRDGTARVWTLTDGKEVARFNNHRQPVQSAAFSPDSQWVVSCGEDGQIFVWTASDGKELRPLTKPNGWSGSLLALFHPQQPIVLGSGDQGPIRHWELNNGESPTAWPGHAGRVTHMSFSPDNQRFLSAGVDGQIILRQSGGSVIRSTQVSSGAVSQAAFLSDGRHALSVGDRGDDTVRLWDLETGDMLRNFFTRNQGVTALGPLPDGKRVLTGGANGSIQLWDLSQAGTAIRNIPPPPKLVRIFEDERNFPGWLVEGDAKVEIDHDAYSGKVSLRVAGEQRYRSVMPGWGFRIANHPGPGEYRYLRFAWKRQGGEFIELKLNTSNGWRHYLAENGTSRFFAGVFMVEQKPPREWEVITRDLFADLGAVTIYGISLAPGAHGHGWFDHIYLARHPDDFKDCPPKR